MHAYLPIPDARRSDPATYRDEIAALVRLIREQCPGPTGKTPTMEQVAELLGISDSTLYLHTGPVPPRMRKPLTPPYTLVYALRALVASPASTRAALWPVPRGTDG